VKFASMIVKRGLLLMPIFRMQVKLALIERLHRCR